MNTTPRVADSEGGHTPRRQGRAGASPGPAADPAAGRGKQSNKELNQIQACQARPVVTSARVSPREWAGRGPRLGRADNLKLEKEISLATRKSRGPGARDLPS